MSKNRERERILLETVLPGTYAVEQKRYFANLSNTMEDKRRIEQMNREESGMIRRILTMIFVTVIMTVFTGVSAMAEQQVDIPEGTYYIKASNGNAKGQVLYWDEKAEDQNTCMMFESCGGAHADNEVWFITKNRSSDDYYGIYLARSYYGDKDKCKRIEIDNVTGRDQPALMSTTGPHVFCGSYSNQDDAFRFFCQSGSNPCANLIIESRDDQYRFFRHKEVKPFRADLIYVKANTKHDTSDKLWELVPVNYDIKLNRTAPSAAVQRSGKVTVSWDQFRNKLMTSTVWKNAKFIEIQYSTDKEFLENVKTKKIAKSSVNKAKAKSALSGFRRHRVYYIRVRLIDAEGICSNWSRTIMTRTKNYRGVQ